MCAEFMIRASNQKIRRALGLPPGLDDEEWSSHVRLYGQAPVIVAQPSDGQVDVALKPMGFSLKPQGTPYPTFNARLLSWDERKNRAVPFFEKPTWKKPLNDHRCLVPMSGFIEPIYSGDYAGQMVQFKPVSGETLFAAGLYDDGVDKETGEIYEGFTLVIHVPSPFVLKVGHHRQPLFLKPEHARQWIEPSFLAPRLDPKQALEFLLKNRYTPELEVETVRTMARGWEKRIAESEKKHQAELQFIERIRSL